jgi:hypothetical protein
VAFTRLLEVRHSSWSLRLRTRCRQIDSVIGLALRRRHRYVHSPRRFAIPWWSDRRGLRMNRGGSGCWKLDVCREACAKCRQILSHCSNGSRQGCTCRSSGYGSWRSRLHSTSGSHHQTAPGTGREPDAIANALAGTTRELDAVADVPGVILATAGAPPPSKMSATT